MPNLGICVTDADDLLRYIDGQMAQIDGTGEAAVAHDHAAAGPGSSAHDHWH